jgi:predicted MPP superfamily phosphohydrolase
MKIIAVGDVHGRNCWEQIANSQTFDKLIFIGDYFDSFNIPAQGQIRNFREIVAYKEANPEKIILLTGNHDFHYLPVARSINETYSGSQDRYAFQIGHLLQQHSSLLQVCYRWEDYLFTHAGVTKTWLDQAGYKGEEIEAFINDLFRYKPQKFLFNGNDPYRDDVTQSPLWVRPRSLRKDAFRPETIRQVVGHTARQKLDLSDGCFFFIDTLSSSRQYLVIEEECIRVEECCRHL